MSKHSKIFIIFLLTLSIAFAFLERAALANFVQNAWQGYKLTEGLIAYWSFDGKDIDLAQATAEVRDQSGNGYNGDWRSHATSTTIGKIGQAITFDGVDDYINIASSISGVQTVAFWMEGTSTPSAKIIDLNGTANIESINGTITANNFTAPTIYVDGVVASTLTAGWHHVVITTGTSINGSAITLGNISSGFFTGDLDEIRFYNRALSADEAKRLYLMGASFKTNVTHRDELTEGLVGYWTFDGQDMVPRVLDVSGQGNNGSLANQPSTTTTIGKIGQGLNFDGTDDRVSMGTPSVLSITGPLSISAWIYPTSFGGGTKGRIIDKDANLTAGYWYAVDNSTVASGIALGVNTGINLSTFYGVANTITLNKWQHVTVTMDANRLVTHYVDSVSVGSLTFTAAPLASGANNFVIGGRTTDNTRNFAGIIDDVRIYTRALTRDEVKRLYLMGASLKTNTAHRDVLTEGLVGYWSFDGKDIDLAQSTAEVRDQSGQGNNGDWRSHATTTTIGKIGQAITFDGVDDYINIASSISGIQTASFWVNGTSTPSAKIIDLNGTANIESINGTITANNFTAPTIYVDGVVASTLTAGWHHVVITTDTSINGSAVTLGKISSGFFTGDLDEIRFYNRALSADEAKRLYLMGK